MAPSPAIGSTPAASAGGLSGDRANAGNSRPIAIVGDQSVLWGDLLPELAEAAGGQVLEEHALGLALRAECGKRGVRVTEQMIRDERALLSRSLARAANVSETEGETLIANVRRTRALGDARFASLLQRNAALRALIRTEAPALAISPEDITTAYQLKYGQRAIARLILVRSQQAAASAAQQLNAGQAFQDVAASVSVDPSADRGGLLDPFSLADANYPVGIRRVLQQLTPNQISEPIAVTFAQEQGFAIVKLERMEPSVFGSPDEASVVGLLEQEVRAVRERAQMDRLAQQLLRTNGVSVMDRSLGWSWEQRNGGIPQIK